MESQIDEFCCFPIWSVVGFFGFLFFSCSGKEMYDVRIRWTKSNDSFSRLRGCEG